MEKEQKKKYIQIIIPSICILILCISIIFSPLITTGIKKALYKADIMAEKDDLVVHFIDVGQGDAIAINFPNNQVMLIDSGPKDTQNLTIEYIKNSVLSINKDLVIDYLILTHPDIDHSGSVSAIFSEFEVKNFYRPNIACESESVVNYAMQSTLDEYNEAIKLSKQEQNLNINVVNKNYEFYVGKVLIKIFSPLKTYATFNEMSPIVKVEYEGKSFLFTGDISSDVELDMIEHYGQKLDADVMKVAHHGSSSSTSAEFINAVTPKYAVISVGKNTYGHPDFNVVNRLQDNGVIVLSTYNANSIRFVCNNGKLMLMDENQIHSTQIIEWWVIAVVGIIFVGVVLLKNIFKIVKDFKKTTKNI